VLLDRSYSDPALDLPPVGAPWLPAARPHPALLSSVYGDAPAPPLPAQDCEDRYGNTWLRGLIESRTDVCASPPLQSSGDLGSAAAAGTARGGSVGGVGGGGGGGGSKRALRSRVTRWNAASGARFSWMRGVALDFPRMSTAGNDRVFPVGFVQAACDAREDASSWFLADAREPALRGFELVAPASAAAAAERCDSWEHTPTLVIQHEDIGNMYHNLADHMRVFLSLALLQQPYCAARKAASAGAAAAAAPGMLPDECPAPDVTSAYLGRMPVPQRPGAWTMDGAGAAKAPCSEGSELVHGLDPAAMQLLNLDGAIMCNNVALNGSAIAPGEREDCEGPFFDMYRRWFGRGVVAGRELSKRGRVCFSALGFAANVPESQVWAHFGEPWHCDSPPSPVFVQYVAYVVDRWGLKAALPTASAAAARTAWPDGRAPPPLYSSSLSLALGVGAGSHAGGAEGEGGAASACDDRERSDYIRVLYVVRKKKPWGLSVVDRVVANEAELVVALLAAAQRAGAAAAEVDAADFTGMPFEEQLLRVRSAHLVVGMHGAGMVHGIHLAEADACGGPTSVLELLPHEHNEWGVGHLTSYAGKAYRRWRNDFPQRELPDKGTLIDAEAVGTLAEEALRATIKGRRRMVAGAGA
jgi:hypothetical protein